MVLWHIVLVKLKPGVTPENIAAFKAAGEAMVTEIPCVQKFAMGPPLPVTADRAKGFDFGMLVVLDTPADLKPYSEHPAHHKVLKFKDDLTDDALAYDFEY